MLEGPEGLWTGYPKWGYIVTFVTFDIFTMTKATQTWRFKDKRQTKARCWVSVLQLNPDNSNLALTRTKIYFPWISFILYCNFTLDNSNLPLTRSNFCFPLDHFYIILPSITRTMFWALKKSGKKPSTGVRNIEFWISHWRVVGI